MKPSKRIIFSLILAFIVIAITYNVSRTQKVVVPKNDSLQNTLVATVAKKALSTDTDGDGLKDWEETLWGTDPNKTDTNGDGVSDYDEVQQKIKNTSTTTVATTEATSSEENLSATDLFSRDFFKKYIALKQSGKPLDDAAKTEIANSILQNSYTEINENPFTLSDLKLTASSEEQLRTYIHSVGKVFEESPKVENELTVLEKARTNNDEDSLAGLDINIKRYSDIIRKLALIPTPKAVSGAHLDLINALSTIRVATEGMRTIFKDPIGSLPKIRTYYDQLSVLQNAFDSIRITLEGSGITLYPDESGYVLMH